MYIKRIGMLKARLNIENMRKAISIRLHEIIEISFRSPYCIIILIGMLKIEHVYKFLFCVHMCYYHRDVL